MTPSPAYDGWLYLDRRIPHITTTKQPSWSRMIRENRIEPDSKEYVYTFYWNKIYKRLLHRRKRKAALRADYAPMIIENRSIPEQSHIYPMNMMVLHSDAGHMIIPSSPRLYRIESIGWTNFIPDRSIPFILMMCEHGWRDYSAN